MLRLGSPLYHAVLGVWSPFFSTLNKGAWNGKSALEVFCMCSTIFADCCDHISFYSTVVCFNHSR